jgi:hypothetical protein
VEDKRGSLGQEAGTEVTESRENSAAFLPTKIKSVFLWDRASLPVFIFIRGSDVSRSSSAPACVADIRGISI